MNIGYHPAPGLGDLLPGFFVVPQNPIDGPVSYVTGIGDILPGSFAVPQNPVVNYNTGLVRAIGTDPSVAGTVNGKGVSGLGCGGSCGCGGGCGGHGGGMGDISADFTKFTTDLSSGNIMTAIQDPIFGIPVWAIGAGLLALFFVGGEKHSYAGRTRRAARAAAGAF